MTSHYRNIRLLGLACVVATAFGGCASPYPVATSKGCCPPEMYRLDGLPHKCLLHHRNYGTGYPCYGYFSTCWRAWPEECPNCPSPFVPPDCPFPGEILDQRTLEILPSPPISGTPPPPQPMEPQDDLPPGPEPEVP